MKAIPARRCAGSSEVLAGNNACPARFGDRAKRPPAGGRFAKCHAEDVAERISGVRHMLQTNLRVSAQQQSGL